MSAVEQVQAPAAERLSAPPPDAGTARRPWWRRVATADLASLAAYLLTALYVTERMWRHLDRYYLRPNHTDQIQFEYFLEHAVRIFTKGQNPFFTFQLNAPE